MPEYRCQLIPLTPIHVGAGQPIEMEDYFLANGRLTRFHPQAVVRLMSAAERNRLDGLLAGGETNMAQVLKLIRECAKKCESAWLYSINVGQSSLSFLQNSLENLDTKKGQVWPLQWNDVKKCAIIPGSAIKGAIRTGQLSAIVARKAQVKEWKDYWMNKKKEKPGTEMAKELENELLRAGDGIDRDLFRFIHVSDAEVPAKFVRVDRAQLWTGNSGNAAENIQMHYERLLSVSDGETGAKFEFTLKIEKPEKEWLAEMQKYTGAVPTIESLLQNLRRHYEARYLSEKKRFGQLYTHKNWDLWQRAWHSPGRCLIRIGRFSHFESLSVEELRGTLNKKGELVQQGTSRTYCALDGQRKLPFGWAMLAIQ
jgi:CRISPR-associated protein Csm5